MKSILVGIDFSPAARNAAAYAANLALMLHAELVLFNIYTIPVTYGQVPMMIPAVEMEGDLAGELNKLKTELNIITQGKINISLQVKVGLFFTELVNMCESMQPYLVVLGSQGSTATERLFLGGHTVYAMRNLPWPVLAVPVSAQFGGIKKAGLACDLHSIETVPAAKIKLLLQDLHAVLHILNVEKKKYGGQETILESIMLKKLFEDMNPEYHHFRNNQVDETLIDFSEKNNLDLLIVLPQHHNLLEMLTHKSNTKQLTKHCQIPILAL
ncbi:MAG: universal stress protein [Chitinophaga sp.]|uniref:universal stress protein n=1 Tax=Chitinophaga sp. TaxID=1869181 RepID=UPI0025C3585F|nr:universal stress protein [Chitinophaga sp.]MBV8251882.1 universal stress protein [Chitinophaga sp.]